MYKAVFGFIFTGLNYFTGLTQEITNNEPQAKSSPLPIFVNKFLTEHSHAICLHMSIAVFEL